MSRKQVLLFTFLFMFLTYAIPMSLTAKVKPGQLDTVTVGSGGTGGSTVQAARASLGVLSSAELATATASLLSNIFTGSQTVRVASTGFTIFQGNTTTSVAGEVSHALPLNGALSTLGIASGTVGYVKCEVVGKYNPTQSMVCVTFDYCFENYDNTYTVVGNPASITTQLNATTWKVSLGSDGIPYATGTVGTIWQVIKMEVGGL